MNVRKLDGMNTGANVLDLSQYRSPKRVPQLRPANPTRTVVDGVIRQKLPPKTTLEPVLETSLPLTPALEVPQPHSIPWRMLITATAVSAMIPIAVLATPSIKSFVSSLNPPASTTTPPVQASVVTVSSMAGVQTTLNQFVAGKAPYGIAIINLKDGQVAGTATDRQFTSASLYKLFVAQSVYKLVDGGQLSLGSKVKGTGLTVDACLNRMITVSDNPCGVALGTLVGWEKQNAAFKSAGYTGTELYKNKDLKTTAGDTALLLKRLYEGTLLSPNSSEHFLGLLKAQKVNNRLPQGLPAGTVIAHKTGDLFGLLHDAGIIYGPKGDYIIAALSGPWPNQGVGMASFTNLSRQVYAEMSK